MVLYKGYCRPLGKKVDFTVEDVISMNTTRGIKWRVKGKFEDYNISTFCSNEKAQELLSKLPLKMDAEIAYTHPPTTYDAEELMPSFSNISKDSESSIITYEAEELIPYIVKTSKAEEAFPLHEQIQENTNAQELELQSEKLPAKYYKKDGSLDMRYTVCREFAAKKAESQNAVELEAPYTPIEPERPSDDYDGGGRYRKKPRRPLGAERGRKAWLEKCDICSEGPIYEKDVNIEDYDDPIQVCQSCFDDIFTDKAAESFEADVESVVSELRELGMPEIVFGDDEERIKINGELVYKIESAPMPIRDGRYSQPLFYIDSKDEFGTWHMDNPLQQFSPPIWIRTPKGLIKNTRFHRNKILERKIQRRLQEDYGEYTKKNPFECLCGKRFKNENALKKHQGDKKHPNYHPSHTLFDNELKGPPINNIINPDGITLKEVYLMFPNWDGNYKTWFGRGEKPLQDGFNYFNAESFEAEERWYVSDPCYAIPEDRWGEFVNKLPDNLKNKKVDVKWEVDGKEYIVEVWQSPGGDGVWSFPSLNCDFGVDAGLLAVIPEKVAMEGKRPFGGKWFNKKPTLFTDEKKYVVKINNKRNKNVDNRYNPFDAESFGAAYTPEQRLDDYTPEQLTTSSSVTGDFFEDSLKYSYGGFQAENEELGETSYAEDVPDLQRAEAGMEVENIEQAYKKKEDQFMTLVVDDATLFRLAPHLPDFVEIEDSQLAGYTTLKFNFVENPEMEQQILSYAIDVVADTDEEAEEPEFKEGDVRNRLFNVEFDDWAEQEMLTHGKDVSFKEWADEESESHGDDEFMDWANHEEESHDERYEAEGAKRRSFKVWGMKEVRKYWQGQFDLQMQDWLEFAWINGDNPQFKTYQGERWTAGDGNGNYIGSPKGVKKSNIPTGTKMRNVINTNELYNAWKNQSPVIEATAQKRCLVSYQEAVPEMHIFLDYMEDAGIDIKEAEWRNLSDFEMGDRDRYALGDEIIAISQTLRENKVDDWRAVKKLGKAIKQGKFTRVRDEMGNIGVYSRRGVWDKHHKDFFELFSDSQIQALGIPWVVNDYCAEITDEYLSELESKLDRKIDSFVKGLNYTQCVACDKEAKVEILEDNDGNPIYQFYSCECGHNDIQDSSYDAESPNKYQLMENKLREAEESDGFIGRIPKSRGLGEKTKILKNNVRIIFEEAQRPLYPMEVMTLYEQKKYGDKPQRKSKYKSSPRVKKLGITQKKLSQIINSQKDRYYVSRRGLIHYIGEGSMQDYIKNLDPKYFAEEDSKSYNSLPDEDDILKFLKESHRFIRKYNAPYKYSSKGMAQKFGVSQAAMRGMMGRMERARKVKSTPRRCEDAPKQHRRNHLKIYYLPDKKLMGA